MRTIRRFPPNLELVNRDVAEVFLYFPLTKEDLDPEEQALEEGLAVYGRSYDYYVLLKDGRRLGFSAFTPEAMREYMNEEHNLSFVTSGLVVVSEITEVALLDALESCLRWTTDYPLEHFGFPYSEDLD